jgi:Flp pilus assembly pilin Flp
MPPSRLDLLRHPEILEWARLIIEDDGQDVVEYGLLIATIVIVVLLAVGAFGSQIEQWFSTLSGRITTTGT